INQEGHVGYWKGLDVVSTKGLRLQFEAGVVDYPAPRADLMTMTPMSRMNLIEITEHRLPIQRDQKVYPVNVGSGLPRINPQPVIAVLTLAIRAVFAIGNDMQSTPDARLREPHCDGIAPAPLTTDSHPG